MTTATQSSFSSALAKAPDHKSNTIDDSSSSPKDEQAPEDEVPEGGTKAWLSLIGASCAMFVSFGWVNCIALFQAEYERNQLKNYNKSTVSWITSMECESSR